MRFRTFVFDLGNVIIPFDHHPIARRLIEFSKIKDIYSGENIHNFLYRLEDIEHLYEEGRISTTDFIRRLKDRFQLDIENDLLREIFCDIFFEPYSEIVDIIKDIKEKKFPLMLLSNTNEMHFEYILKKYSVLKYFDHCVLSYKVGFRKPDIRIYEETIKIAGCSPDEIFYTDDIVKYIEAAKGIGISAYLFKDPHKIAQIIRDAI